MVWVFNVSEGLAWRPCEAKVPKSCFSIKNTQQLKLTASLPLKIDAWKTILILLGCLVRYYVSFREAKFFSS